MAEQLQIGGWLVAQAELEERWSRWEPPDIVWLFRSLATWTLVTMGRRVRYDDHDVPADGRATVTAVVFCGLDEVTAHIERTHRSGSWVEILDVGHAFDDDLYRAWVPERIERDFQEASIYNRDLARAAGHLDLRSLPAPGRALPDWQVYAVEAMTAQLEDLGYEVAKERPEKASTAGEGGNEVLGALRVRRYGYEALAIVRVDDCGEIYVRLADSDAGAGPPFQAVPHGEDDSDE